MKKQSKNPTNKNPIRSLALKLRSKSSTRPKKMILLIVFLFAVVGASILAISKAEDPNVPIGIIKTQYAYPSDAIFVSPNGNDSSSGVVNSPLQTLQAAVDKAPAGSTIVMRSGTYREELRTLAKRLTIQPYPNEDVWLDGSDIVSGWTQEGNTWRKDGWNVAASLCPNSACYDQKLVTAENPAAGLPDMVFINGTALEQVLTKAEVGDGSFYVDRAASKMYIGTNPNNKMVEASTRKEAIFYYSAATSGSKLRGIGVRRFASNLFFTSKPAQIEVSNGAKGIEFDNMVFTQSSSNGLFLTGSAADKATGIVVKNSVFANNGASGLSGNYTDGLLMENSIYYNNNTEKAQWDGEYGSYAGAKIARMTNSTVRNNLFQDNYSTGFWCDLDCSGNTIVGNMTRGNHAHGIFYEVSYDAVIASNVSYNNGEWGFKVNGRGIKVYNNTAYNNHSDNIFIYDDSRLLSQNIEVKNNISAGGPNTDPNSRLIFARMSNSVVGSVITGLDSNLYYRSTASSPNYVLGWQGTNIDSNFRTLDSTLRNQTGREAKGILVEGKSISKLFKDAPNGDFKLISGSEAVGSGEPLPADVAVALGRASSQVVDRGALTWRAGVSNTLAISTPDKVPAPPTPVNQQPKTSISLSGTSYMQPASFQVSATATDSDGTISKLEILQNSSVVHTCYGVSECRYDANGYGPGVFSYSARAYDNVIPVGVGTSGVQSLVVNTPTAPVVPTPDPIPPVVLTAPTGVSTTNAVQLNGYPYKVNLQWAPVIGATGYTVTRSGQSPVPIKTNTYTDSTVAAGYPYTYQIAAMNGPSQSPATVVSAQVYCFLFFCWSSTIN